MRDIPDPAANNFPGSVIARPALIKKMRALSARKNIFISAPGGYGKTIAAGEWLASARGNAAKMQVGDADNDPNVFFRRLAQALCRLTGRPAPPSADSAAEVVQQWFPARHARCHLLIDDLHKIENEEVLGVLPLIAARLPGYVRLCVASRSAPAEALMETGLFATLTEDDLRFSPEEAEWLAEARECALTKRQIRGLLEATGGWAMYLSALVSDSSGGPVDGVPRSLSRYLETSVWDSWSGETRDVLAALAVPETIAPELCERLTGRTDGRRVLERLMRKENAFLSRVDGGRYRFHDIFREFLLARAEKLGRGELRRLHDIAAKWHFEQGDYLASTGHYIKNLDHEGISRCIAMTFRAQNKESGHSVDQRYNFTIQHIVKLPDEFIAANPYLLLRRALAAYYGGHVKEHLRYADLLHRMLAERAEGYPDLAIIDRFMGGINPRIPLRGHIRALATAEPGASAAALPETMSGTGTITQNLPFFHRSMRDFSEYHELNAEDLRLFRRTLGVFMGGDYEIYEQCLMAGIHYEKGDALAALRHALNARHGAGGDASPEAFFSANAILAETLCAMGAAGGAKQVLAETEAGLNEKARCLIPNLKAIQAGHAVRAKEAGAAEEWLAAYAARSERMPFYQMPRHFTTLRSYVAMGYHASAIRFGGRLHDLAALYRRPLDQIESGMLVAVALRAAGKNESALDMLGKALELASPYGFAQLFLNEGKEMVPMLLALRERTAGPPALTGFMERLCGGISGFGRAEKDEPSPRLPAMRRKMLEYLAKGMSYGEIAAATGIAPGTAKRHVLLLYRQLGVHAAAEAVAKARMTGMLR